MKKYIGAALLALLIVAMMIPTVAWFGTLVKLDYNPPISGSTGAAFFAGGDGSVDSPYIISEPVHLYNMAWLQYIGYFNLNPESNNGRAQSYFKVTADLDMSKMSALPPIGTTQYPFHGNFDGGSCVISNLTTANLSNEAAGGLISEHPTTAEFIEASKLLEEYGDEDNGEAGQIMGFFGVIGDYNNSMQAVVNLGTNIQISGNTPPTAEQEAGDTTGGTHAQNLNIIYTQAVTVKNVTLNNYTLQSDSTETTLGLVAGYVNAEVADVLVGGTAKVTMNPTKNTTTPTANVSDYTLVGYCTDPYKNALRVNTLTAFAPNATDGGVFTAGGEDSGTGQGWGGSIAMDALFDKIDNVINTTANRQTISNYKYYDERILNANGIPINESANPLTSSTTHYRSALETVSNVTINKTFYSSVTVSDYFNMVFLDRNTEWMYIAGGYQNVDYQYTRGTTAVNAYVVRENDADYLNLVLNNGVVELTRGNDATTATKYAYDADDRLYADIEGMPYYLDEYTLLSIAGVYINSGTNYLSLDTNGNLTTTAQPSTVWYFSNSSNHSGVMYAYVGDTPYYLIVESQREGWSYTHTLTTGTNADEAATWTNTNGRLGCSVLDGYFGGTATRYILYNNGYEMSENATTWNFTAGTARHTVTQSGTMLPLTFQQIGDKYLKFDNTNSTYIPLQMQEDDNGNCMYIPKDGNTGYITSGSYSRDDGAARDLRVSQYAVSSINDRTLVRVINPTRDGYVEITLADYENDDDYQTANLVKFKDAVTKYQELISGSYIYGLHFMRGRINMDSLVTIPKAVINGQDYSDYQVPADCIDFSLKEKGYINFFAGTYYSNNNFFFTLHHIERNADSTIKSIREISKVYESRENREANECVYEYKTPNANGKIYAIYKDGEYKDLDAVPSDYEMTFDLAWITTDDTSEGGLSGWANNWAYYFEVPASPGEYALGSSEEDGKNGAYLIYLDISANAQEIERTVITECFEEELGAYEYSDGAYFVQMNADGTAPAVPENEFSAVVLQSTFGNKASVTFVRDGTTITVDPPSNLSIAAANGVTFQDTGGNGIPTAQATTVKYQRVTYLDRNLTTKETTRTVITRVENPPGTFTVTAEVTVIAEDGTETPADDATNAEVIVSIQGEITKLNTDKPDNLEDDPDQIDWSQVTRGTETLSFRYQFFDIDAVVTNSIVSVWTSSYNEEAKRTEYTWAGYAITINSDRAINAEITEFESTDGVTVSVNGNEVTGTGNLTIEEEATTG